MSSLQVVLYQKGPFLSSLATPKPKCNVSRIPRAHNATALPHPESLSCSLPMHSLRLPTQPRIAETSANEIHVGQAKAPSPVRTAVPERSSRSRYTPHSFGSSSSYSTRSFTGLAPALTFRRALKSLGSSMKVIVVPFKLDGLASSCAPATPFTLGCSLCHVSTAISILSSATLSSCRR